jgi:S-adenosylmethionine hydrolase
MLRHWIVRLVVAASLVTGFAWAEPASRQPVLVLQSDFGLLDGAVASMKGVAVGVSPDIHIYDLTHQIEPYNIWQGALRLAQTAEYWPAGTVFVSVVDPGVGTERKSIVLRTKSGHYFVIQTDDGNYGNIWTNIDRATFGLLGVSRGDTVRIQILKAGKEVLNLAVPFVATFGAVDTGKPLLYLNSLDSVSLAINQENFAKEYGIGSGPEWSIQIRR